jgi:hypothetical protein
VVFTLISRAAPHPATHPAPSHHEETEYDHHDHDERKYPPKTISKSHAWKHVDSLLSLLIGGCLYRFEFQPFSPETAPLPGICGRPGQARIYFSASSQRSTFLQGHDKQLNICLGKRRVKFIIFLLNPLFPLMKGEGYQGI